LSRARAADARPSAPAGIPPEFNFAPKDVNGIQVPMSATPEGMRTVLVDSLSKRLN
jgi:hypothetical protein